MLDELKLQRLKREFIPNSVSALKRDLRLTKLPRRIECFDISNIQGTDTVASMVVFEDGRPKKNDYRKFKIRTALNETGRPDDFASMREVIYRRYIRNAEESFIDANKEIIASSLTQLTEGDEQKESGTSSSLLSSALAERNPAVAGSEKSNEAEQLTNGETVIEKEHTGEVSPLPDLIVIDGGKGQLSSAVKVLDNLGIKGQNIIGLAKKLEEVFIPGSSDAQSIPKTSSGLKLLQRIRDEAHRFAITYHRSLRDKRTLKSELEDIKGIGKATAQKLLKEFGSVEKIKQAMNDNYEDFEKRAGKKGAERLKKYFETAI